MKQAIPLVGTDALPDSARALSSGARQLLEVAAAFGRTVSVEDLAEVLDQAIGQVLAPLHEVLAAEVLVPDNGLLVFADRKVQRACYGGMVEPIRTALHGRIGAVMLRHGGSAVPAAAHLIAAARPHDELALVTLDQASRELMSSAPAAAAELALRAMQLTAAADDQRFARIATAVEALLRAGRLDEARRLGSDTLASTGAPGAMTARLRVALCAVLCLCGQPAQAVAESEVVLAEHGLPGHVVDAAASARLRALLALDDTPRIQMAAEAILAGDVAGAESALVTATVALAWLAWADGRVDRALGLVRAAVRRCERARLVHVSGVHPRLSLATMLIPLGDLDQADSALSQADEEIELAADTVYWIAPRLLRARLHLAAGRLDDAQASAQAALQRADDLGAALFVPPALATLAAVSVQRGDLHDAAQLLERARREVVDAPQTRPDGFAHTWAAARLACAHGDPQSARETLAEVYLAVSHRPAVLVEEPDAAAWLTRLALASGCRTDAVRAVACAEGLAASSPGSGSLRAAAAHARGLLDHDPVAMLLAASDYRHPWGAASAAEDAGSALIGRDRSAAVELFRRALAGYDRVGAAADRDRVRSRLRTLGVRSCHWAHAERPQTGWRSLTDTEIRVARLVAEGATNAQAAARLFLSPHTVGFHLRQIFRKLGIRSRVELTRVVLEQAIVLDQGTTTLGCDTPGCDEPQRGARHHRPPVGRSVP
ncbi:MAG TPA: LuxR C-terminal-related transcriptional regulator [Sporichthyaceae bacterium]|nr:LuxR C-terminal-related transcriptional regulator [Sporichthyaceae bacterium]